MKLELETTDKILKEKTECDKLNRKSFCELCGKEMIGKHFNSIFCSEECRFKYKIIKFNEKTLLKVGRDEYDQMVECKICGLKSNNLNSHISSHNITGKEYKEKYGGELHSLKYKKWMSQRMSGENNIIHKIENKQEISPFCEEFYLKKGFSEEEAKQKVQEHASRVVETRKNNNNVTCTLEYWLKKCNGNEEEARKALRNRQQTFTLKKCIKKFGKEQGIKRWQERQEKWLNTLDKKTDEEKTEINKKKLSGPINARGKTYSKISQELFIKIYEKIKDKYPDIYFATKNIDGTIVDDGINKEFILNVGITYRLLDFYIPSVKKMIEFDGTYWHGEKENKKRDKIREKEIISTISDIKIHHVEEKDYRNNPEKILKECLEFLSNE